MKKALAKELLQFIEKSPSTYHVIENVRRRLLASGYTELEENARWNLVHGGKYFLTRGGTSCIAFRIPEEATRGFMLTASHSDSPSFKKQPRFSIEPKSGSVSIFASSFTPSFAARFSGPYNRGGKGCRRKYNEV